MRQPIADGAPDLRRSLLEAGLDAADRPRTFKQPWHAQAFALAVELNRNGLFTWPEWVAVFSHEIQATPALPGEDPDSAYYRQWLAALEQLVVARHACLPADIDRTQSAWRQAYLHTPHGQPVDLANAAHHDPAADEHDHHDHAHHHDHDHDVAPKPIAVSPALR